MILLELRKLPGMAGMVGVPWSPGWSQVGIILTSGDLCCPLVLHWDPKEQVPQELQSQSIPTRASGSQERGQENRSRCCSAGMACGIRGLGGAAWEGGGDKRRMLGTVYPAQVTGVLTSKKSPLKNLSVEPETTGTPKTPKYELKKTITVANP